MSETEKPKPPESRETETPDQPKQLDRIEALLREIHDAVVVSGRQLGH